MGIKTRASVTVTALTALAALLAAAAQPVLAAEVALVQPGAAQGGSSLSIEGQIEPLRQATVAAQIGGNVLALLVKAGDSVKAGQAIARIDERDAAAGVLRSDAALAQAEAEAQNARTALERTRELRAQGFVSQAALDTVQTQAKAAQAGVQQAQAARAQATLARSFALVSAPFAGVVLATHLEAGDLASPGRPIVTLYSPGAMRATAQIPLSQAPAARRASRIEIELANGQRVAPAAHTELAGADPVSQTLEWRLDLPAAALPGLLPGQVARVHFLGAAAGPGTANTLRLPAQAVLRRGELAAVYVAQGEGFALRAVRLGADRGAQGVEILAGLKPGEKVAAHAVQAGLVGARPAQ
ncbi:MAG: efflux transporter periplasmic adaptor subunit [Rubrivivax sp. SCN 71-131]|jgi:RND family efflux transporter MFP subunit|nr:MAG: efflux transporter periplasmic adaptor subunit [Rubrivivax sp. SCN 71-131]